VLSLTEKRSVSVLESERLLEKLDGKKEVKIGSCKIESEMSYDEYIKDSGGEKEPKIIHQELEGDLYAFPDDHSELISLLQCKIWCEDRKKVLISEFVEDLKFISSYEKYAGYDKRFIKIIKKWEERVK